MQIKLNQISKRFSYQWILKSVNFTFAEQKIYGICGPNGCGKSTFLQIVSGYLSPSEGSISYKRLGKTIGNDQVYKHLMMSAPYISLIDDFTIEELYQLHFKFGYFNEDFDFNAFLEFSELDHHIHKPIKHFSSGMMQRLKLSLSLPGIADVLILDEPTSYFDVESKQWFYKNLIKYRGGKLTLLASNDPEDLGYCDECIDITIYKSIQ